MNNETPPVTPQAPPPPPGKAKPGPAAPKGGRSLLFLLVAALTGALAVGTYLGWRAEQDLAAQLDALRATLDSQRAAEAAARTSITASVGAAESAAQGARAADAALVDKLAAVEARVDTLAGKLAVLPQSDADALGKLALAEAGALVRLAEQRLLLARDAAGAAAALNLANARLPDGQGALGAAIARDLAAVANFKDADLPGLAAELGALADASRTWPAAMAPATDDSMASSTPTAPPAGGWQGFLQAVWHDLRQLVEIHATDAGGDPLLDPHGASLSRQRFVLAVEGARLAVLGRDAAARDASLQAALAALRLGFAQDHPEVRAAATRLADLASRELAPTLPVLESPAAAAALAR